MCAAALPAAARTLQTGLVSKLQVLFKHEDSRCYSARVQQLLATHCSA